MCGSRYSFCLKIIDYIWERGRYLNISTICWDCAVIVRFGWATPMFSRVFWKEFPWKFFPEKNGNFWNFHFFPEMEIFGNENFFQKWKKFTVPFWHLEIFGNFHFLPKLEIFGRCHFDTWKKFPKKVLLPTWARWKFFTGKFFQIFQLLPIGNFWKVLFWHFPKFGKAGSCCQLEKFVNGALVANSYYSDRISRKGRIWCHFDTGKNLHFWK